MMHILLVVSKHLSQHSNELGFRVHKVSHLSNLLLATLHIFLNFSQLHFIVLVSLSQLFIFPSQLGNSPLKRSVPVAVLGQVINLVLQGLFLFRKPRLHLPISFSGLGDFVPESFDLEGVHRRWFI